MVFAKYDALLRLIFGYLSLLSPQEEYMVLAKDQAVYYCTDFYPAELQMDTEVLLSPLRTFSSKLYAYAEGFSRSLCLRRLTSVD